jgi:hypothetical protein
MKVKNYFTATATVVFAVSLFILMGLSSVKAADDYVALYRLYNAQSRAHLYTSKCDERDNAVRGGGFVYENIAGYVASRQMRRTVPLYRLLLSNGAHFYTTDFREMTNLSGNFQATRTKLSNR